MERRSAVENFLCNTAAQGIIIDTAMRTEGIESLSGKRTIDPSSRKRDQVERYCYIYANYAHADPANGIEATREYLTFKKRSFWTDTVYWCSAAAGYRLSVLLGCFYYRVFTIGPV
jgi:hypothetical protein